MSVSLFQKEFPRAIIHIDGDSFFASVEQTLNWKLRGKPVVVGAERGAPTAVSVEAKKLGLSRGMSMKQIRAQCPQVIVVNSDYTAYVLFARRMYALVRRIAPMVEEYSIDECFADITGLDQSLHMSYEHIAKDIQRTLHEKLGITFGVGLGPSKVLAKTASKYRKPAGFTSIPVHEAHHYLETLPVGAVWGIGPSMAHTLGLLGVHTALEFAHKPHEWLQLHNVAKPYRQIWSELRGVSVHPVREHHTDSIGSIQKTRTFSPSSIDASFVYSQLARNVERACAVARRQGVLPREIHFFLKTQDFLYGRRVCTLAVPTNDPRTILAQIEPLFKAMYKGGVPYRATGISLTNFTTITTHTNDLFGESITSQEESTIFEMIDTLNRRFGRSTLMLGASMLATKHREPERRKRNALRKSFHMPHEFRKKTIDLPFLGTVS